MLGGSGSQIPSGYDCTGTNEMFPETQTEGRKNFRCFSRTPKQHFHFSLTFSIGKKFDYFFKVSKKKIDIFDMRFLDFLNENFSYINPKYPQESKNHT